MRRVEHTFPFSAVTLKGITMHTRIASFAIICLLPLIAAAELPQVASVEGVTQYELKNGAKVLLMPDGDVDYFGDDWLDLVSLA